MGIGVFSLWQDFDSAVNTSINGWFRPESDFIRAVNEISIKIWNRLTNDAEKSQEAKDKLFPYLMSKNIPVENQSIYYGIAKKPSGYGRFASARVVVHADSTLPSKEVNNGRCEGLKSKEEIKDEYYDNIKEYRVQMIDNQRWSAYCEHLTKGPTIEKPGITQVNDSFKVAPRKVSVIVIDYYVEPKKATFNYTLSVGVPETGSGDQIIFNPTGNQDLEWPESVRNEFLEELKTWYATYSRDQLLSNINAQSKQVNP